MMNILSYILYFLLIISFIAAVFTGNGGNVSSAVASGSIDAVKLSINILAMMTFWSGIIRLAEKCGITDFLNKIISPFIKFLFPKATKDDKCFGYISVNFISNMLGLANASTPAGIKAITRMNDINLSFKEKGRFIVINCCSIQLIPTSVAAIRANYGSLSPFDIILPVFFTSFITVIFALMVFEVLNLKREKK
ncbi:MAG: spore maturation protein [Clostridia bacterium]